MTQQIISLSEARSQGLTQYFTGKPCKWGHTALRLVSDRACMECARLKAQGYHSRNRERITARQRQYHIDNQEKILSRHQTYRQQNPHVSRKHTAQRRAARLERTPKWADLSAIDKIYAECPEGYEVDHDFPLQGKFVSGLHVENNLRYLTQSDNRSKANSFQPQFEEFL